jgi:hypothetical protein
LDSKDDVALFTEGGCSIFALALHEQFRYNLAWIPGHPDSSVDGIYPVSHVFGLLLDGGEFAVDVWGTRTACSVVDGFGGCYAHKVAADELTRWRNDPRRGIFPEQWFWEGATARARLRIARYREYFDGTQKAAVPSQGS